MFKGNHGAEQRRLESQRQGFVMMDGFPSLGKLDILQESPA